MAELATLARPYANAVFDLADQAGELDRWSHVLALLTAASAEPAVRAMVEAPEVKDEQKAHQLLELVREDGFESARRFVHVLASNKRLLLMGEISEQFETLKAEKEKTLDVEIHSAVELTVGELERLVRSLERHFEQDIEVSTSVDASLIGGAIIRTGDTVIDGSVRGSN